MSTKKSEQTENWKLSLEFAKSRLADEQARGARLDTKLNFLLVFLAALIAGLHIIFPLSSLEWKSTTSTVLLIEFLCLLFCAIITVFLGMYPKTNQAFDANCFCDSEANSSPHDELLERYVLTMRNIINSYLKTNEKKGNYMRIAFVCSAVACFLFCTLFLLKII